MFGFCFQLVQVLVDILLDGLRDGWRVAGRVHLTLDLGPILRSFDALVKN
jgi:hypothetical protein